MKVAVVGSRDFADLDRVKAWVAKLAEKYPAAIIVSGGARGVDTAAEDAAKVNGLAVISYRVAGGAVFRFEIEPGRSPIARQIDAATRFKSVGHALMYRNGYIVDECDVLVAFHDGESSGTQNSIERADTAGKLKAVYTKRAQSNELAILRELQAMVAAGEAMIVSTEADWKNGRAQRRPFDLGAHLRKLEAQKREAEAVVSHEDTNPAPAVLSTDNAGEQASLFDVESNHPGAYAA